MKTLQYSVRGCLLILALLVCIHAEGQVPDDTTAKCPSNKADFSKEFPIAVNSEPYILNADAIKEKENLFNRCVKCSPLPTVCVTTPLAIPAWQIKKKLYDEADLLLKQHAVACANNSCITGVWLIFGMENGKIVYLFRTALLKSRTATNNPVFDSLDFGKVYSYANNGFTEQSYTNWRYLQEEYFAKIRVQKYDDTGTPEPGKHRRSNGKLEHSWRGNSRMLFYSFREILGFYSDRNPQEDTSNFYCGNVYINHSAGRFSTKPKLIWHKWHVKHNTFITVDTEKVKQAKDQAIVATSDDAADLAHVCPSRCNELQYPREEQLEDIVEKQNKIKIKSN